MRKTYTVSLILVAISSTSLFAAGVPNVDPACVEKILTDGRASWHNAASQVDDLEVLCHQRSEKKGPTNRVGSSSVDLQEWKISWKASTKRRLVELDHVKQKIYGVHVSNDRYKFFVGKTESGSTPIYKIGGASKYDSSDGFSALDPTEENAMIDLLGASSQILGFPLQTLIGNPDFQLNVAKYLDAKADADRSIRLEWECVKGKGPWGNTGAHFWVELNPTASWLIDRCGIEESGGKKFVQKVEYQSFGKGFFPKAVTKNFLYPNSSSVTDFLEFEQPHPCQRPEAEFYLPYYGMSESIVDVTRTSSWTRVVAVLLSLLGVMVSIYFYRMSRKSTGPTSAAV